MALPRLSFIGCGRVGQTLGLLWQQAGVLQLGDVLNRSPASAAQAVRLMMAGRVVGALDELQAADIYLLGCPDDQLTACSQQLAASGQLQAGAVVLHCSGAHSSAVLSAVREQGALTASVHPVKSFAAVVEASRSFIGTYCAMEGDPQAVAVLEPLFKAIGGIVFAVNPEQKLIYHAASVIACNYLVTLQEVSVQAFAHAGLDRELALSLLQPLVSGTVANVFKLDTAAALTGPIARGDVALVGSQLNALRQWQPAVAELYRLLGQHTIQLARQREGSDAAVFDQLQRLLEAAKQPAA